MSYAESEKCIPYAVRQLFLLFSGKRCFRPRFISPCHKGCSGTPGCQLGVYLKKRFEELYSEQWDPVSLFCFQFMQYFYTMRFENVEENTDKQIIQIRTTHTLQLTNGYFWTIQGNEKLHLSFLYILSNTRPIYTQISRSVWADYTARAMSWQLEYFFEKRVKACRILWEGCVKSSNAFQHFPEFNRSSKRQTQVHHSFQINFLLL